MIEKLHRGVAFSWDDAKAKANPGAHDGVTFDEALDVFFDPFMQLIEASRNHQLRHRAIGYSKLERLLVVVHLEETETGSASSAHGRRAGRNASFTRSNHEIEIA